MVIYNSVTLVFINFQFIKTFNFLWQNCSGFLCLQLCKTDPNHWKKVIFSRLKDRLIFESLSHRKSVILSWKIFRFECQNWNPNLKLTRLRCKSLQFRSFALWLRLDRSKHMACSSHHLFPGERKKWMKGCENHVSIYSVK